MALEATRGHLTAPKAGTSPEPADKAPEVRAKGRAVEGPARAAAEDNRERPLAQALMDRADPETVKALGRGMGKATATRAAPGRINPTASL
jgi:hypothetical protein